MFRALSFIALALLPGLLPALTPIDPKINGLREPLATSHPLHLSWKFDPADPVGARQTAWELELATSPQHLEKDRPDLWDSGKIVDGESLHRGLPHTLPPGTPVFARLRVWDETDLPSAFTPVFRFMSPRPAGFLMEPKDTLHWIGFDRAQPAATPWRETPPPLDGFETARWITGDLDDNQQGTFIRDFEWPSDRKLRQATLFSSGDDSYTVSINGISVATGKELRQVAARRVTFAVFPGNNRIEVRLHNQTGPHGFIGCLVLEDREGRTETIPSDTRWSFAADGSEPSPVRDLGANGIGPWGKLNASLPSKTYLPVTYLRHAFTLPEKPSLALLHFTALGHVNPEINGRRVDDSHFSPGWTDYRQRLYYRTVDVLPALRQGDNVIALRLADGWFRGNISILGQNRHGQRTRAKALLEIRFADGRRLFIPTGPSWKASTGGILEADMFAGESFDANLEPSGWTQPGFDDSAWSPPDTGAEFEPALLLPYPMPPVRPVMELPAQQITEPRPGVYIVDFGQNFSGNIRLRVRETKDTLIQLRFGEMLEAGGHLYTENLRSARATDHYICAGSPGGETWEPSFTFHGFRYAEIRGLSSPPGKETLTGIVLRSDLEETGSFECSDPLIRKIERNTLWGQRSNYLEVPTDCPQRDERMGWSGDTQVFANTACYQMDASRFLAKWLVDLSDAQKPDGAFPAMAPVYHDMWSPGWADAATVVPWTLYRHYGDLSSARSLLPGIRRHLELYRQKAPNGIGPNEGFGDWLAIGDPTPKDLIATAYRAHSHDLAARLAEALGEPDLAGSMRQEFRELRQTFQETWVKPDGRIGNDTQTGYLMALRFDLLTAEQRPLAARHLVAAIERRNGHLDTGFLGINLLLPTLSEIGRTDLAYQLIQKRTYPSWGYSIDQGATTIWERWNSYTRENGFGDVSMNSFNHYAYGACVEWLYETVLGIRPLEPGFRRFEIAPQPGGGLTFAKGSYHSIRGLIRSSWQHPAGGDRSLEVSIPPNTEAWITVPSSNADSIRVAAHPEGRPPVKAPGEPARFRCLPGDYRFTYR